MWRGASTRHGRDSSDGPISPLQGGSEDRYLPYLPTLPSVFDRGGKELAARDLDVETGVSEERGRLPDIEVAHEGRSDGDRAAISSGGAEAGRAVEGADESTEKRAMSATQRRNQRKYKEKAMARGEEWMGGLVTQGSDPVDTVAPPIRTPRP